MTPDTLALDEELEFPSSDGNPMSENTRQYEAIVTLKGNIEAFAPLDAFVAGDHLIYVDRRDRTARQAPDVYVAFGRPRGHRGSYKLWREEGVFPQVIFEVLAPSNTADEMARKRAFYFRHGAEEYYEFDPEAGLWTGFVRDATGTVVEVPEMDGHTSRRLGMRFEFQPLELRVFRPDGARFLSFQELEDRVQEVERQRLAERRAAEQERSLFEQQRQALEEQSRAERQRAEDARRQADEERRAADQARHEAEEERQRTAEAQQQAEDERQQAEDARRKADEERRAAELARREVEEERQRADAERHAAEAARREAERVRALLRAAGIDPDPPA